MSCWLPINNSIDVCRLEWHRGIYREYKTQNVGYRPISKNRPIKSCTTY